MRMYIGFHASRSGNLFYAVVKVLLTASDNHVEVYVYRFLKFCSLGEPQTLHTSNSANWLYNQLLGQ